jgi:hypothetical protein
MLPEKFDITNMAYDISKSNHSEPKDPDFTSKHLSIYKAVIGQSNDKTIQVNQTFDHMEWNDSMQGLIQKRYSCNEMYCPSKESGRRPQR